MGKRKQKGELPNNKNRHALWPWLASKIQNKNLPMRQNPHLRQPMRGDAAELSSVACLTHSNVRFVRIACLHCRASWSVVCFLITGVEMTCKHGSVGQGKGLLFPWSSFRSSKNPRTQIPWMTFGNLNICKIFPNIQFSNYLCMQLLNICKLFFYTHFLRSCDIFQLA